MINVAVIIETIFAWPGIGRLLYEGISFRDFPVVQGLVVMARGMIVGVNVLLDLVYAWIDPRIRYACAEMPTLEQTLTAPPGDGPPAQVGRPLRAHPPL